MNIKLTINGKEIDAQISEADAQKIQPSKSRFLRNKVTYHFANEHAHVDSHADVGDSIDDELFSIGNYFTSEKQAQDHVRALKLWQAIKVFRQEREGDEWKKLSWNEPRTGKYSICYDYSENKLSTNASCFTKFAETYFAKRETAQAAIDEFYGELMWYFTEFEDD